MIGLHSQHQKIPGLKCLTFIRQASSAYWQMRCLPGCLR